MTVGKCSECGTVNAFVGIGSCRGCDAPLIIKSDDPDDYCTCDEASVSIDMMPPFCGSCGKWFGDVDRGFLV